MRPPWLSHWENCHAIGGDRGYANNRPLRAAQGGPPPPLGEARIPIRTPILWQTGFIRRLDQGFSSSNSSGCFSVSQSRMISSESWEMLHFFSFAILFRISLILISVRYVIYSVFFIFYHLYTWYTFLVDLIIII